MADLTVWFGAHDMTAGAGAGAAVSAIHLSSDTGRCVVETLLDCASSKQTAAAKALSGASFVPFIATASNGSLWIKADADPTAVAAEPQNFKIHDGAYVAGFVRVGDRIAAINA